MLKTAPSLHKIVDQAAGFHYRNVPTHQNQFSLPAIANTCYLLETEKTNQLGLSCSKLKLSQKLDSKLQVKLELKMQLELKLKQIFGTSPTVGGWFDKTPNQSKNQHKLKLQLRLAIVETTLANINDIKSNHFDNKENY